MNAMFMDTILKEQKYIQLKSTVDDILHFNAWLIAYNDITNIYASIYKLKNIML